MTSVPLVDTHCHLQDGKFDDDREAVLARSLKRLEWLIIIGDDLESSREAVALCHDGVYAAVGLHPYHAALGDTAGLQIIRNLAQEPGVVAIGEIGLDYSRYSECSPEVQEAAFTGQLQLAHELNLPVVIHNRDAHDHMRQVMRTHGHLLKGGVMHCFAGDPRFVEECLEWGLHISFAGNVTFPKAEDLREAARTVPLDRLLVETDSPYLAPQPVRGKRCEPIFVEYTAAVQAELHGVAIEELARITTQNAEQLFGVRERQPAL